MKNIILVLALALATGAQSFADEPMPAPGGDQPGQEDGTEPAPAPGDDQPAPPMPEPTPAPAPGKGDQDQGKNMPGKNPGMNNGHHGSLHYSCRMDGQLKGLKLGWGIGGQYMSGKGAITCVDLRHGQPRKIHMPVKVRIIGGGLGFDFTIVRGLKFTSGGLGYVHSPMDLTGSFSVGASSGVTLIKRGYNVNSAISVKKHAKGLAFELGFSGEKAYGLGARLHGTVMTVRPLRPNER